MNQESKPESELESDIELELKSELELTLNNCNVLIHINFVLNHR